MTVIPGQTVHVLHTETGDDHGIDLYAAQEGVVAAARRRLLDVDDDLVLRLGEVGARA